MDGIKKGTITVPVWAVTQKLKVLVALVSAVKRYNDLHEEIFGKVEFSMPERLSENNLRRIDMTFLEFLEKNDLHALSGFLMFAHAAQGYGYKYLLFGTNPVSKISEAMMGSGVQDLVRAPVVDYTDDTERPIMYSADKMSGPKADGSWYADRYDDIIFGEVYNPEVQVRVGYQFYETHACIFSPDICGGMRQSEELEKQQVKDVTILRQFPWPYFHHFSGEAIQQGMPWDLVQLQGQHKTWWIGASASFESVHDVTNYNLMLLKMYLGARVESGRVS
eukprot:g16791.t1